MSSINNEPVKYDMLSKVQKLSVFLIAIGPEGAAQILESFDDFELEAVCTEVANIKIIDQELCQTALREFAELIGQGMTTILGGGDFAHQALEMARGDYKATSILGRISPVGNTPELIQEISEMEPRQIFNLVRDEQPQTVAFLVSHLNLDKATQVIAWLSQDMRLDVVERIGGMEETSLEMVAKVVTNLKRHTNQQDKQTTHHSGGLRQVADILNNLDKDVSKTLLSRLEEHNPGLGAAIRKKMFSFDDLGRLDPPDLQRVTREVEMADLVLALKSAQATLQQAIFNSVSKRASETLKEEMEMLGPVRLKDVEAAQDRIIQIVRRLEEEEEITLDKEGGTVV